MFLTRIKRGALRTGIVLRTKAELLGLSYRKSAPTGAEIRVLAVTLTAAYTAVMPVMALRAQAAAPHQPGTISEDAGEPPSISPGIQLRSIRSVRVESQVVSSLAIGVDRLADISVGKSLNTARQEEEEAKRQAELAQIEKERQSAAAARAAEQARQLAAVAAAPVSGSVEQSVHDAAVAVFGEDQWPALRALISRESGFNPSSYNSSSGACGLFQALPCSKMGGTELGNQISWGIGYIRNRYGTPSAALAFHNLYGWY